ncbi:branched-chain amino acid aminotransferase [Erythrobacteraceae bacterium CFH 75059]|uniref:branched-chain amino acid aminotransferase n=1 Tax=Qipengyuania thermophila TaxID=2509361 RepID=UPI0010213F36|nr:branched-chain amino acid aminotransferase [Qipengyuania thermophila]TCD05553.1 branched-chain amino acid aminotransferase [Erythrobacteraceae bacterium CFH 75059]
MTAPLSFTRELNPDPLPTEQREAALASPGFGKVFTDHMIVIDFDEARGGWHTARLCPRGPLRLDPAAAVLHYAQEIFEGLKVYRHDSGRLALFRPEANAARLNASARRMAMPTLPEHLFLQALGELMEVDGHWFPAVSGGSIYLRPFMIATEAFLGVRPARQYKFIVIASPVGGYFKSDAPAVSLWVSRQHVRAAPGGTGAAKTGGNYAASLIPIAEATEHGCDQVVFLDAVERTWVEELGGMNLFFVLADGRVITPPLTGTILPGITRDSLITLLRDEGVAVAEEPYSIDRWRADAGSGVLSECFACGTAAVVTPVGSVLDGEQRFTIGDGAPGPLTKRLRERLTRIQSGSAPDPYGWVTQLG